MLCRDEGASVSSGLSRYFGDSEDIISQAVADEKAVTTLPRDGADVTLSSSAERPLLADLLTPFEVGS